MAMMNAQPNETRLSEADEIEAMLPWLITGKLGRDEQARISRYLETHPDAAAHVALAREEQDAVIDGNEAIKGPSASSLDRLMASIGETPQARSFTVPSPSSVWEKVASFITGISPTTLGIAGAAAAIVLVAQAATIGVLMTRDGGGAGQAKFNTASDGQAPVSVGGVQALVVVQPGVTVGALTDALRDLKASVVDGPRSGMYRLRVNGTEADAAATIAKMKGRTDIFSSVNPAPR